MTEFRSTLLNRLVLLLGLVWLTVVTNSSLAQPLVDRSQPPTLGPPPSLDLPETERFALENGIDVLLLRKPQVPVVEIKVFVRAGSALDPENKIGLAAMTAEMLDEGVGVRNSLELAEAVDFLGAKITTWSDHHDSGVTLFSPVRALREAVALLADVVLRPTFPQDELDRLRLSKLTELQQARDEPRTLVTVQFQRTLFGRGHPYGAFPEEADIRSIEVKDLGEFHSQHFRAGNASLIVVGAVTPESIRELLEESFGSWEGEATVSPEVPARGQVAGRTLVLVDNPGAAQSEIRIGRVGVSRSTEDYYPLVVMNTVLGGSFASRLNSNLREDKGYSYGAGSVFLFRKAPGPFLAGAAVQTDVTDKALEEFVKELDGIGSISEEELDRARNYVAYRFPSRFQTVSSIAGELADFVRFDLEGDYFDSYVERVLAVTRADVERVAEKYIDTDNMIYVIVGDRAAVEEGISSLEMGSIEHLTVEQILGPPPKLD